MKFNSIDIKSINNEQKNQRIIINNKIKVHGSRKILNQHFEHILVTRLDSNLESRLASK
jgi:hypothetical protein